MTGNKMAQQQHGTLLSLLKQTDYRNVLGFRDVISLLIREQVDTMHLPILLSDLVTYRSFGANDERIIISPAELNYPMRNIEQRARGLSEMRFVFLQKMKRKKF